MHVEKHLNIVKFINGATAILDEINAMHDENTKLQVNNDHLRRSLKLIQDRAKYLPNEDLEELQYRLDEIFIEARKGDTS